MRPLAAFFLLSLLSLPASAAQDQAAPADSAAALPAALERLEEALYEAPQSAALFLYPPPVRGAVLLASTRPALVARMAELYGDLALESAALLDALPARPRRALGRLIRYPALVADLSRGTLPAGLPARVRRDARRYGLPHRDLLQQIHHLQRQARDLAGDASAPETEAVRDAFAVLLRHPETLRTLDRDMRFTVLLGEAYRQYPMAVRQRTDELGLYMLRKRLEKGAEDIEPEASPPTEPAETAERPRRGARQPLYAPYGYDTGALDGPDEEPADRVSYHPGYPHYYRPYPYYSGAYYRNAYYRPYRHYRDPYYRGYAPVYFSVGHPNFRLSYYGPRYYSYGYRPYGHHPYHHPYRRYYRRH